MKTRRTAKIIATGIIVALVFSAGYVVFNSVTSTKKEDSIPFKSADDHIGALSTDKIGTFTTEGNKISIYLGRGSGGNTAEVAKIFIRDGKTEITINANYCGSTRDMRPLMASVELDKPASSYEPIGVKINTVCGEMPAQ